MSSNHGAGALTGLRRSRPLGSARAAAARIARGDLHVIEVAAIGAAIVLALGFAFPTMYDAPTLRTAVETAMALFALAAAALLRDQFHRTRRLRLLLLFTAIVILAVSEFVTNGLAAALHLPAGSGFASVYPLGQLIGATTLLVAARTPVDALALRLRRPILMASTGALAVCGVAELAGWLLHKQLLLVASASSVGVSHAVRTPVGFTVLVISAFVFVWAGGEFSRRAWLERDRVLPLIAAGALLLGAARIYTLSLPFISPETISLREGLRFIAFGVIFYAVLRRDFEIRARTASAAAAAERHRVAQDLHDSLAQDLAFIAAHEPRMAEQLGEVHPVTLAARHALAVSRQTINDLSASQSTSPGEALDAIAHELGERFGMRIVVHVAHDVGLARQARDQVARITREAIANAARHGGARHVFVTLKRTALGTGLRVIDDGCGISEQFEATDEGFGISSMRERVASLGGTLTLRRAGAEGTELEILFP